MNAAAVFIHEGNKLNLIIIFNNKEYKSKVKGMLTYCIPYNYYVSYIVNIDCIVTHFNSLRNK